MFKRFFFTVARALLGVLLLAVVFTVRAHAQTETPPAIDPGVSQLLVALVGIPGFALLATAIVNALKAFGLVKDGSSGVWLTGFNLLGVVLLFVAGALNLKIDSQVLSEQLRLVANALVAITALFGQNKISAEFWYPLLKRLKLPVISTSFKETPQDIVDKLKKG